MQTVFEDSLRCVAMCCPAGQSTRFLEVAVRGMVMCIVKRGRRSGRGGSLDI